MDIKLLYCLKERDKDAFNTVYWRYSPVGDVLDKNILLENMKKKYLQAPVELKVIHNKH